MKMAFDFCILVDAPYNLEILLFWGASMNIQRVARHGFEMYLAKYISKPESSFNVKLSQNPTEPEKYYVLEYWCL